MKVTNTTDVSSKGCSDHKWRLGRVPHAGKCAPGMWGSGVSVSQCLNLSSCTKRVHSSAMARALPNTSACSASLCGRV